jgi:hypothetical protein
MECEGNHNILYCKTSNLQKLYFFPIQCEETLIVINTTVLQWILPPPQWSGSITGYYLETHNAMSTLPFTTILSEQFRPNGQSIGPLS